ncbi:MBL fold metallo-hydrolase [Patulibacter defluvii]|uniref:MBL fold metallo-hydrolase n=1 Tax=Patulibacter defluvii TaxID=3095358 RepID=UPI002A758242|nr:MBL fold metallo-hydrolase [Patulibacter sp. DM4]
MARTPALEALAPDVWRIELAPGARLNAYLLGDVLVDAGMPSSAEPLLRAIAGHPLARHVLTHVHVDHAGGSRVVADARHVPVACGAGDLDDLRAGRSPDIVLPAPVQPLARRIARYRALPQATALAEDEPVGPGFRVVPTPGHTAGHLSLWRESDRLLIAGDALFGQNVVTGRGGLQAPPRIDQPDPPAVRAAIRRLAALEPEIVAFGHGHAVRGAAGPLQALADGLPA